MNLLNNEDIRKKFSLKCFYPKDAIVYHENDICDKIGYIVKGELNLIHFTSDGSERILARLKENQIFGDFLINSQNNRYPANLVSVKDSEIVFMNKETMNYLLIQNYEFRTFYLQELSDKALNLNKYNKILIQPNLREKIMMYLHQEKLSINSKQIPIKSKEYLANYLNVARPSLSRELALMKKDGLIDYDRDYITILS
ncbi:MAG: Crp/Fnr family transcriptional regulator [Candidatus Izemoplasmatales bacterium]|nr:Crp/Fnr family transcriptional regulator [Candidatus Izemoplasmatales bacterium]